MAVAGAACGVAMEGEAAGPPSPCSCCPGCPQREAPSSSNGRRGFGNVDLPSEEALLLCVCAPDPHRRGKIEGAVPAVRLAIIGR